MDQRRHHPPPQTADKISRKFQSLPVQKSQNICYGYERANFSFEHELSANPVGKVQPVRGSSWGCANRTTKDLKMQKESLISRKLLFMRAACLGEVAQSCVELANAALSAKTPDHSTKPITVVHMKTGTWGKEGSTRYLEKTRVRGSR